jgi:hypothetical protein
LVQGPNLHHSCILGFAAALGRQPATVIVPIRLECAAGLVTVQNMLKVHEAA